MSEVGAVAYQASMETTAVQRGVESSVTFAADAAAAAPHRGSPLEPAPAARILSGRQRFGLPRYSSRGNGSPLTDVDPRAAFRWRRQLERHRSRISVGDIGSGNRLGCRDVARRRGVPRGSAPRPQSQSKPRSRGRHTPRTAFKRSLVGKKPSRIG